jgi:hypothetical protein
MRPMKRRTPGSANEALARMTGQIAGSQGRDPEAGVEIAAAFENIAKATLYKMLDPDQPEQLSYDRVARWTAHFGVTACAEHLAELAGGVFLPLPADDGANPIAELSAKAATEFGNTMAALVRALAPDSAGGARIVARERPENIANINRLMRVLAAMRARIAEPDQPPGGKGQPQR